MFSFEIGYTLIRWFKKILSLVLILSYCLFVYRRNDRDSCVNKGKMRFHLILLILVGVENYCVSGTRNLGDGRVERDLRETFGFDRAREH